MPRYYKYWGQDNHPIVFMIYDDAIAYCNWAGVQLPTEAQWEKAARGTDGRIYPWGNEAPDAGGRYRANYYPKEDGYDDTAPVGSFPLDASPYGVMDMAGNVQEWCADWYDENYYASAPNQNPQGPSSGTYRLLRGGSWAVGDLRAAGRDPVWHDPTGRYGGRGFRCMSPHFPR
jgi:formylglycine-generating enzyme required for sulfatase activity